MKSPHDSIGIHPRGFGFFALSLGRCCHGRSESAPPAQAFELRLRFDRRSRRTGVPGTGRHRFFLGQIRQHIRELSFPADDLVGQYAHNTRICGNSLPLGGFDKVYARGLESATIATWLQAAGYRTALFGKYLNGYPAVGAPAMFRRAGRIGSAPTAAILIRSTTTR
ncbi:sulfatase-like hydrolase/transferase [Methylococcus capsulatus]|uniref:Sulfatase-like hydrolase/transferase n=1 Tax=Methylococcus capsulatus TaxID=414 RepID=A0ABZ2F580_METCP|nr:sulfatase-like hydrolase/transferase [Methylococcus capsulatus]